ncbi:transcription antitermination factor NusB [Roseococcus suduntuyensis]|uniref:Transcription antitermination protein NusB n=1 Tax=Roseococcus suduntuyensis TaxID=455361 RepID=A0A840ACV2_9PROT|nr:transcription antitermination factor NusB [Roseococcus suduntuyensis]MBB3898356.1 N utilization substance protein B [Roseococcus suduntuyensis]
MKPRPQPRPTGNPARPRTGARVAAVQALFQAEQSGESVETVLDQFVRHRLGSLPGQEGFEDGRVEAADVSLFARVLRGAATNPDDLDQVITQHLAQGWALNRLDPVLRAILRAAGGEMRDMGGPPARVVIKEYMDIAHGFFGGEEPRFCNGVLDAMARSFRAEEFARQ